MRIVWNIMPYLLFLKKQQKLKVSSAAVVIGALRVNSPACLNTFIWDSSLLISRGHILEFPDQDLVQEEWMS